MFHFLFATLSIFLLLQSWNAAEAKVLGASGPIQIGDSELLTLLNESRANAALETGETPPLEVLRDFNVARNVVIEALENRLISHEALLYGIAVEPSEITSFLEQYSVLNLEDLEANFGLPAFEIYSAASHKLLRDAFADALVDNASEKVLLAWHDWTYQLRDLSIIKIPRVPRSSEIDAAIPEKVAEIKNYYDSHPALFGEPEKIAIQEIVVTPKNRKAQHKANKFAHELHDSPNPIERCQSHQSADIDCTVAARRLPISRFSKDERQAGISNIIDKKSQFNFAVLGEVYPANMRPLDDPRVQREAAAAILIEEDDLPFARAQAERAQALLDSCQEACWPEVGTELFQTGNFSQSRGRIPKIGLAPDALEAAFALTDKEPVSEIFTVRQSYIVMKLEERIDAPDFDAEAREKIKKQLRPLLLQNYIQTRLKNERLWIDDNALQAEITELLKTSDLPIRF